MAVVSKSYGVGDTVFVWYHDNTDLQYLPQSRVVKEVGVKTSGNESVTTFTNGQSVIDGATARVFTTEILCAADMTDAFITNTAALVAIDVTTSITSTAAQPSVTLGRIG